MNPKEMIAFGVILLCLPLIVIYTDMMGKSFTETHYLGNVVITSPLQEDTYIATIKSNADYGDLNFWKPGYYIETIDNGTILHYAFFSKNKNIIGFTKSK